MTAIDKSPQVTRPSLAEHLRLVWALALKDIADALKTRATLATILISLLMVGSGGVAAAGGGPHRRCRRICCRRLALARLGRVST